MQHTTNHFNQNDSGSRRARWQRLDVWTIACLSAMLSGVMGACMAMCGVVCVNGASVCVVFVEKNLNASRHCEHPPARGGGDVKTFRWDHRLQKQNLFVSPTRFFSYAAGF